MNLREWALVAFTLLMQTSVGVFLVAAAIQPFASRSALHASGRPFDLPVAVAAGAAVLALLVSLAHLGHPLQAWLALANVRTSWLSREIVSAAAFAATTLVLVALSYRAGAAPALQRGARVAAVVFGLACLFSMARLYMVPAQPVWNRLVTPATFLGTTFVLGACVTLACWTLDTPGSQALAAGVPARSMIVAAIVILAIQLLLLPVHLSAFARDPAPAVSLGAGTLAASLAAARAIAGLAAIVALAAVTRALPAVPPAPVLGGLALVAASEVFGRVLFYAGGVRLGAL